MNLDGLAQLSQFGVANSHLLWCMSLTWWKIESSLSLWWWQWGHTFGPWYRHTLSGSCRNRYLLALLGSFFIGFAKGNPTQNTWPFALCWTNSRMYQEHGAPSSGVWFAHLTLDFFFLRSSGRVCRLAVRHCRQRCGRSPIHRAFDREHLEACTSPLFPFYHFLLRSHHFLA